MKVKEIQREHLVKTGEELEITEIAKKLKVTKEEIIMAGEAVKPLQSVDEESYDDKEGETKLSKISNGKNETDELINKICLKEMLDSLKEKEKQIILLRYYRGKTQNEIAKMFGTSQVQISRIEKKILQQIKKSITN